MGYGDRYPVTTLGRITAFVVMLAGVGIIGALASILASVLVSSPSEATGDDASTDGTSGVPEPAVDVTRSTATADDPILARLDMLTAEVAELRSELGAGHQRI